MTGTKVDAMELLSKTLQDGQGDFMKQALALTTPACKYPTSCEGSILNVGG